MGENFRERAREAFPQIDPMAWICFDPSPHDGDREHVVALETAPDELILADAEWFAAEGELDHAQALRTFVEWRREATNVRHVQFKR